jgi:hypothetical protein
MKARLGWLALASLLVLVGWDFATATTFLGDDYLFRAFAQLERNPLVAFVTDKHGGEYYRPIPMVLWWVLERLSAGHVWLFAMVALFLHACCSILVAAVGRAMGFSNRSSALAGVLFFIAPTERDAALWFSASTDLLAASAVMGAFVLFLRPARGMRVASAAATVLALFSKETAVVLFPLLVLGRYFRAKAAAEPFWLGRCVRDMSPHITVALVYWGMRTWVLGGLGGTNDPVAPWWARGVQIASGVVHALSANAPIPEPVAWLLGGSSLLVIALGLRTRARLVGFALLWVVIALAPLPAAGWVVGARYFYLPAVGLALGAAAVLEGLGNAACVVAVLLLLGLGVVTGAHRSSEVRLYRSAVAAARMAVTAEFVSGDGLFLVRGGVKDLDLAIKLSEGTASFSSGQVVLADVPASFIALPKVRAERLRFLLANPPLPTSGGYRFGGQLIVGQARRDEAPDLDVVMSRLPELRIIDLHRDGDRFTWSDRTADYRAKAE